jgi:hypothetical protein
MVFSSSCMSLKYHNELFNTGRGTEFEVQKANFRQQTFQSGQILDLLIKFSKIPPVFTNPTNLHES